eukprot:4365968-Prymnesium_polylepis.1
MDNTLVACLAGAAAALATHRYHRRAAPPHDRWRTARNVAAAAVAAAAIYAYRRYAKRKQRLVKWYTARNIAVATLRASNRLPSADDHDIDSDDEGDAFALAHSLRAPPENEQEHVFRSFFTVSKRQPDPPKKRPSFHRSAPVSSGATTFT